MNKPMKVRGSRGDRIFNGIAYVVISILTLIVLIPMINVVSSSFSSAAAINGGKVLLWPVEATLENYKIILGYESVWMGYRNTIFYTVAGTLINVFMTLICAYPLSVRSFSGRKFFSMMFFITMIFNGGMIPNYMLMRDLRFINTVWAVLLPGAMTVYNMIITRTFIQSSIPQSLHEAAELDGCSDFRYLVSIVVPLSKAVMAVIALYYAIGYWNSYFNAMIYLYDRSKYPLQMFLREILIENQMSAELLSKGSISVEEAAARQAIYELLKYSLIIVASVPVMIFYPFIQKYFVKGVMIGGIKG